MVILNKYFTLLLFLVLSFESLFAQDCSKIPESKKLEKILSKIEDTDDLAEKDALFIEAIDESDNDLSVQLLFNKQLVINILNEVSEYRNKIPQVLQQTISLNKNCDLGEEQNVFLMKVLFAQRRYNEFINTFSIPRFESDSLNNVAKTLVNEAKVWMEILSAKAIEKELVPVVSTKSSEYLPYLSTDGRFMYYTRKITEKSLGSVVSKEKELFMRTRFSSDKKPIDDLQMPKPFNYGKGNYGGFSSTLTGDELFLTICKSLPNGYRNCDIYSNVEVVDSLGKVTYTELVPLPSVINSDTTWESQPAISADGKTLYFAHFPGEIGGIDIYSSTRDSAGNWQQAKPIKGNVNTELNEKAPFIHADGKHLYFSSDQKFTLGAYDLFYAEIDGESFTNVKNLSAAINTQGDDHGIQIDADGKTAYVSSNVDSRDATFDIYKITLPEKYRAEYRKVVTGYMDYLPEEGLDIELVNSDGERLRKLDAKRSNKRFATLLNSNEAKSELLLKTTSTGSKDYFNATLIESSTNNTDVSLSTMSLKDGGYAFTLENVLFGVDDAIVSPKSKKILKAFANYMQEKTFNKLRIIGHTDNQGDADYNLILSEKRAKAVAVLLEAYGIDASKLESIGKGDTMPVVANTTEANRYKNRRTEVEIIK